MKNQLVAEILIKNEGIDVLKYNDLFLTKSIQRRITETGCDFIESYCTLLKNDNRERRSLLETLQISYSEFFRNPLTFSLLEKVIIPTIVLGKSKANRNEIRIWSAACASGQETYSLAILLNQFRNSNGEKINFRIFATDRSEHEIAFAQEGCFDKSLLSNLTLKQIDDWFTKNGELYVVKPELKENIEFSVFDLFDNQFTCPPASIFGDFDIIMCANLLFYYDTKFRKDILNKTSGCLSANGYLITGETERDILLQNNFQEVFPQSAIFKM